MRARAAAAICLGLVLGCGLPGELHDKAASLAGRIDRESEAVDAREADLERFRSDAEAAFLLPYLEREQWQDRFAEARAELEHARAIHRDEIGPLLDADRAGDEAALREQMQRLVVSVERAQELARKPAARAAVLRDARDRAPELRSEGAAKVAAIAAAAAALGAEVTRASGDYEAKAEDLAERYAPIEKHAREARDAQAAVEREFRSLPSADLAILADSAARVTALEAIVGGADQALRGKIGELYRSYSKTLLDMKTVSTVEIARSSWNEAVDFARETERRWRVEVSEEALDALETWGDRPIATASSFFGRTSLNVAIDSAVWEALGLDPWQGIPRGDDSAQFWVDDSQARYFHRYLVVEGSDETETDWVEVPEEEFEERYDDLGMDILSKPYGVYEDEALQQAAPPGMGYVGDPRYGEWKTESDGRRRWSWGQSFLFYSLLFGGPRHHYYYNDWRGWNSGYRGRNAWYGPAGGGGARYGTYGSTTRNSSRYAASSFGRRGGFQRADRSLRGAGPSGRGGGPGGGGK